MQPTLRIIPLALAALIVVGGCQQPDRAKTTPPTRAELPTFAQSEQRLPISVGIDGSGAAARTRIVPEYPEIQPTPEERAILRIVEEPELDALAFYRAPRTPEDGVSAESFLMRVGIGGHGGAFVGRNVVYQRVSTYGRGGTYAEIGHDVRSGAAVGRNRTACGHVGRGWGMSVGETLPRRPAERAPAAHR
jgi:hypothetical protein